MGAHVVVGEPCLTVSVFSLKTGEGGGGTSVRCPSQWENGNTGVTGQCCRVPCLHCAHTRALDTDSKGDQWAPCAFSPSVCRRGVGGGLG